MNVLFDMETGDPDDLITLLLLICNRDVQLRAITCWQGSPIQIGLIKTVLSIANISIPIGGLNTDEPNELSPYYSSILGKWKKEYAIQSPSEVIEETLKKHPDTHILTGAPLTNLSQFLNEKNIPISQVTSQGGFLGYLVPNPLEKFRDKKEIRTYNFTSDPEAFVTVNNSEKISKLTFITKDLCHGFSYTPDIHKSICFSNSPIHQLLKSCLGHYAALGKSKAMHDPLAMLFMLYPHIGTSIPIHMSFRTNEKGHSVFSSVAKDGTRFGLIDYNKQVAWDKFKELCESQPILSLKLK